MNTESNFPDPEVPDDDELERNLNVLDDVTEEAPDKASELPSSLNFPNRFFQG